MKRLHNVAFALMLLVIPSLTLAHDEGEPTGNPQIDLSIAISRKDGAWVKRLLHAGALVNPTNPRSYFPLMGAAASGSVPIVKILVEAGAKVNALNYDNSTALMTAAAQQRVAVVAYLLKKGANPKLKSDDGTTALSLARHGFLHGRPGRIGEIFYDEKRDFAEIIRSLKAYGAKE